MHSWVTNTWSEIIWYFSECGNVMDVGSHWVYKVSSASLDISKTTFSFFTYRLLRSRYLNFWLHIGDQFQMGDIQESCSRVQEGPDLITDAEQGGGPYRRIIAGNRTAHWLLVLFSILGLVVGQAAATLLSRYYFDNGGNSRWISTLLQTVLFQWMISIVCIFLEALHLCPLG